MTSETMLRTPATLTRQPLQVRSKRSASDCVVELELVHPDGAALPGWQPGAHIELHLPSGLSRQYSLCGNPDDNSSYRLGILNDPTSRGGSSYVHTGLAEDDILEVSGPRNNFELVESPEYHFLAAGIGVTPMMPMLDEAERRGARWKLTYMGRSRSSMAFWQELAAKYPGRIDIRPDDEFGFPDLGALLGKPRDGVKVYACGPEGLLRALEGICAGWPAGTLHLERFAPKDPAAAKAPAISFRVKLALSGMELEVPARPQHRGGGRGSRRAGHLLLHGRHLRHLRDPHPLRRGRPPRLRPQRRGKSGQRDDDDLRLAVQVRRPRTRTLESPETHSAH